MSGDCLRVYGRPDFECEKVAKVKVRSTMSRVYPPTLQKEHLENHLCERMRRMGGDALVELTLQRRWWFGRRRVTLSGYAVRFAGRITDGMSDGMSDGIVPA